MRNSHLPIILLEKRRHMRRRFRKAVKRGRSRGRVIASAGTENTNQVKEGQQVPHTLTLLVPTL